jgi:hypothetical protein
MCFNDADAFVLLLLLHACVLLLQAQPDVWKQIDNLFESKASVGRRQGRSKAGSAGKI